MALMFSRLANNFAKNGYYPTDDMTLTRILSALDINGGDLTILDPCCGEGAALADVKNHLTECGARVTAYGIEFDEERAFHAKTILDMVAHSDVHDVFMAARSQSLLFLNPPYGELVADKASNSDSEIKNDRLEKMFYRKTVSWLQFDGVMVLIVPYYVLDKDFSNMIARHFSNVKVFMAPENKFKQCVVFGIKKRSLNGIDLDARAMLERCGLGEADELPETWSEEPYLIPDRAVEDVRFQAIKINPKELEGELLRLENHSLWSQFSIKFAVHEQKPRQPLAKLSDWHLALALAAGQITGIVESNEGRRLLIQGGTHKEKIKSVAFEEGEDDNITETTVLTDKFVPVIRGIDVTPGASYGKVVEIR